MGKGAAEANKASLMHTSACWWSPKCPRRKAAQPQRNVSELSHWASGWILREQKRAAYQAFAYSSFWNDDCGHAKGL